MNKEYADKLVKAMESGKYRHGSKAFRYIRYNRENHCVLGVLCDIIDPTKWTRNPFGFSWKGHHSFIFDDDIPEVEFQSLNGIYRLSSINDRSDNYIPVIQFIKENWRNL